MHNTVVLNSDGCISSTTILTWVEKGLMENDFPGLWVCAIVLSLSKGIQSVKDLNHNGHELEWHEVKL